MRFGKAVTAKHTRSALIVPATVLSPRPFHAADQPTPNEAKEWKVELKTMSMVRIGDHFVGA